MKKLLQIFLFTLVSSTKLTHKQGKWLKNLHLNLEFEFEILVLAFHADNIFPVETKYEKEMVEIGLQQFANCRMLMDELFCLRLFFDQEYFWSWLWKAKVFSEIFI